MINVQEVDLYSIIPGHVGSARIYVKVESPVLQTEATVAVEATLPFTSASQQKPKSRYNTPDTYVTSGADFSMEELYSVLRNYPETYTRVSVQDVFGDWVWIRGIGRTNATPVFEITDSSDFTVATIAPHLPILVHPLAIDEDLDETKDTDEIIRSSFPIQVRHLAPASAMLRKVTEDELQQNPSMAHTVVPQRMERRWVRQDTITFYLATDEKILYAAQKVISQSVTDMPTPRPAVYVDPDAPTT